MKLTKQPLSRNGLIVRGMMILGLTLLNMNVFAQQDPSCWKTCGAGIVAYATQRWGCGCASCCTVTLCQGHSDECQGYTDNHNDWCNGQNACLYQ